MEERVTGPQERARYILTNFNLFIYKQPFLVEDDGEELIKSGKETSTRRRSVSSDRAEQREGLRDDEEEASYGGKCSVIRVKSSKCVC